MGETDTLTKRYMQKAEHFADAFNFLFDGEARVIPEKLQEKDVVEMCIEEKNNNKEIAQKIRDVLKKSIVFTDGEYTYVMLGLENQTDIHYAMPIKNMLYDALQYDRQLSSIAKRHKKENDVAGAEFTSGFLKEDKITPVITLVVYWGTKEWDGPRFLSEMYTNNSEIVRKYAPEYKLNLIVPKEIKDFSKFETEMGTVMQYLAAAGDADELKRVCNDDKSRVVTRDAAMILKKCAKMKIDIDEKDVCSKGGIDMCRAQEIIEERITNKVRAEEKVNVIRNICEQGLSFNQALKLTKLTRESIEQALKILGETMPTDWK